MKVFLIWIGIIGCGVANGFLYAGFGMPENLAFVLCTSIVCAFLLIIHRRVTKNWKVPDIPWTDGFHFPFFRISMCFSVVGLVMFLAVLFISEEKNETEIVAKIISCISVALASFVGYVRERQYTEDWIWRKIS